MNKMPLGSKGLGIGRVAHKKNTGQRENTMSLTLSILVAALNLLVLPPSRQSKRQESTWTQIIIF